MTAELKVKAAHKSSSNWLLVVMPGLVLAAVGGLLLCVEALRLGPLATPGVVASYHFGSEAMVGHGGWPYLSQSTYVVSSGLEGAALLVCALALGVALGRRRASWLVSGYVGLAVVMVAVYWPLL